VSVLDKFFSRKPNQPDFAEAVIRAFKKAGVENVEAVEGEFALKVGDGKSTIYLSNVYANYCSAPRSRRPSVVAEFVTAAVALPTLPAVPTDYGEVKPALMPAIRDAAYFSIFRLMQRKGGKNDAGHEVVTKPFVGGLVIGLAYDTERNITSVNHESFAKWGVSLDDVFKTARENLWEKTDPAKLAGEGGVYWSQWGDSYDSSRILLTELIYRLSVDGDPVAFVPNRNELWVTGTNNSAGIRGILKQGKESHFQKGHPLSPDLYVLVDGVWKEYVPADPALRELWLALRRHREAIDYAQQQELLNAIHEKEKIDLFVASYKIYERKDGTAYAACVWSNGIDSSLPRAEHIVFMVDVEAKDFFTVPWDAAVAVVGNLLEPEAELVPARYRARQFPGSEQIAELRKLAAGPLRSDNLS